MKKSLLRTATFTPRTTHNYVRGGVLVCIALLTTAIFTSCENFLKAQDVANQIKKKIEYNNTEPYAIYVDAQKDTGIITKPAGGEADVKPTDSFNLSFTVESDYQFIKWEVYDAATEEAIDNNTYLKIDDPSRLDTTCTFLAIPDNSDIELAIRTVTAKRPKIVLGKPTYQETGSPRTAEIQVLFDQVMDQNCIYYTDEEIKELKESLHLKDSDFLQGDSTLCKSRYYGYKKNGKRHFKNIQIINYDDPSEDMSIYYCNPHWAEQTNVMGGSTLIIPTTNPPPPKGATLYVSVDKSFCYMMDDIPVKIVETKAWPFKIMTTNEDVVPAFILADTYPYYIIKYKKGDEWRYLPYTQSNQTQPDFLTIEPESIYEPIPTCADKDSITLSFCFKAVDEGGSGLSNKFHLNIEKWNESESMVQDRYNLPYLNVSANEAYTEWSEDFTYTIPREYLLKNSGKYCFTVEIFDNDGNPTKLSDNWGAPCYFWINFTNAASDLYQN